MSIPVVIATTFFQLLAGLGFLATTSVRLPRSVVLPVSLLMGMVLHSIVLLLFDVFAIDLSKGAMVTAAGCAAVAMHGAWPRVRAWYATLFAAPSMQIRLHDIVTFVILAYAMYIPLWASWYWPVTPFDAMAGIDLVARTAVAEGRIDNSVFTDPALQGRLSNQPFYAPFTMLMQVITRLMGFPFGQVWLGVVAVMHVWVMWMTLRMLVQPLVANVLVLLLVMTPEVHGYMYLLQTDFVNSVYMTLGVVAMMLAVSTKDARVLALAAMAFAAACWSRTESVLLVGFGLAGSFPLLRQAFGTKHSIRWVVIIAFASAITFALWHVLYFRVILPQHPDTLAELTTPTLARLVEVVSAIAGNMIFDVRLWGWTFYVWLGLVGAGMYVAMRSKGLKIEVVGNNMVAIWALAVFLGLVLTGTIFSSAIVEQTLRRGIFKLVPLMFLLMATMPIVQRLAQRVDRWETASRA
jgi:hypothetical protein